VRRRLLGVAALGLAALATAAPATAATRAVVPGSKPVWAKPARQHVRVPARQRIDFAIYLRMRNARTARALAKAVSTPRSARYGHYLSNRAYARRFAPTRATARAVVRWLRARGLRLDGVSSNRSYVMGHGRARAVERAFRTRLNLYRYNGHLRRAASRPVSMPRRLARHVLLVGGLSQSVRMHTSAPAPIPGFRNARPCSQYWGQKTPTGVPTAYGRHWPWAPCGYTPPQLRSAYGIGAYGGTTSGAGVTVATTLWYDSPTWPSDVRTYSLRHGVPVFRPGQASDITPLRFRTRDFAPACGGFPYDEQSLDVEAIHGVAPAAKFIYSGANSCYDSDLLVAMHRIVDADRAQIVSNSWGSLGEAIPEPITDAWTEVFVQAALKGIGMYFSSGDSGDELETIGSREPDSLANNPFVTAVGGTALGIGKQGQYLFETGWGTGRSVLQGGAWTPTPPGDFFGGAGGGTSRVWAEPWYQKRVVPRSLSHYFGSNGLPTGGRVVPDVGMDAEPSTGMLIGFTQEFPDGVHYGEFRIGGTSLSAPLFAGVMAIADQKAGMRHGFANPALYRIAGTNAYHDVVNPPHRMADVRRDFVNGVNGSDGYLISLRTLNFTGTLHTRPGYDDVTGVGSPRGGAFFTRLNAVR
jgi:subtilase family serine protease